MTDKINDGGPAFPYTPPCDAEGRMAAGYPYPEMGMTLRDWFAGQATEEDVRHHQYEAEKDRWVDGVLIPGDYITREEAKYRYADAMLAARGKP